VADCPKCGKRIVHKDRLAVVAESRGSEDMLIDVVYHIGCFVADVLERNNRPVAAIGFCSRCELPIRVGQRAVVTIAFVFTRESPLEREEGNAYHAECFEKLCPRPPDLLEGLGDCRGEERPPHDTDPAK
jgi:hypothetical protein